jgi:hypothetical protein
MSDQIRAQITAQKWLEAIDLNNELGSPAVLYVALGDWNVVAQHMNLEPVEARRLPRVARFMDNPVMVVPDLNDGIAYLGKRIMP